MSYTPRSVMKGRVKNKMVYLAFCNRYSGHKEVLKIWIEQTRGNEGQGSGHGRTQNPRCRGYSDAVSGGFEGFSDAIS